jgi:ABC-2 type transport system permease protein
VRHHGNVYRHFVVAGFRRQSTYRLAALGGLVANTTFGFLKVAILFAAIRAAGGEIEGYDAGAVSAYVWISQAMLGSVNLFGRTDLADRIRDGDVVVDFLRPVDVQGAFVATEFGRSLFAFLPRGLPTLAIGVVVVGVPWPGLPALVLGLVSLLLAITVSATTVYLIATAGFWMVETRGLQLLYMIVSGFLAGLFIPIWFFPDWLVLVASLTPFPSMMMYPTDILSGRVDLLGGVGHVALQVLWLGVTLAAGQVLTRRGRRQLEVQGG